MSRPRIIDCFPYHDEADILECRLYELYDSVDWFVAVEADVTHQDVPKPFYLSEQIERFDAYADKLVIVRASGLPTKEQDPDPWSREIGQREHIATGLRQIGVTDDDVILQSDVDEIPRPLNARNARPGGAVLPFGMRGHFWAIDWLYPKTWWGTVAATVATLGRMGPAPFGHMRMMRNQAPAPAHHHDVGWHLSWVGDAARARKKVESFCHPEVYDSINASLESDNFYYREGFHVDGLRLAPVDVDGSWPRWVVDGHAPASWFRPRDKAQRAEESIAACPTVWGPRPELYR